MKIVETDSSFELHISSSVSNNIVVSSNKKYNYKRLVIPNFIINFFKNKKNDLKYIYLYFINNSVYMSDEKLSDYKFSRRKIMKYVNKNTYFINLNEKALAKHNIVIRDSVLFSVSYETTKIFESNIYVKLFF